MHKVTRRRAFRIVAAAAGLPLLIAGVRAAQPKPRFFSWQGEVLGAASELTLWHSDEALAPVCRGAFLTLDDLATSAGALNHSVRVVHSNNLINTGSAVSV